MAWETKLKFDIESDFPRLKGTYKEVEGLSGHFTRDQNRPLDFHEWRDVDLYPVWVNEESGVYAVEMLLFAQDTAKFHNTTLVSGDGPMVFFRKIAYG